MGAAPGGRDGDEKKEEKKGNGGGDAGEKMVSFTGLFRYADGTDVLLMLLGTVGALANGITQPLMTVIFGQVINAFGGAAVDDVLSRVNKVSGLPENLPPRYLITYSTSLLAIDNHSRAAGPRSNPVSWRSDLIEIGSSVNS
ncbi:unnamed protein product [Urochloa humidicola]